MADSTVLRIPKLIGSENWEIWSIRMEAVLTEKGYYEIMTSEEPNNLTQSKKALAYIRLALADGPLLQTRNIDDPRKVWTALKQLYEPKGFSSEFLLCKQLFETTLSRSKNIESYLNQIRRLTDDLSAKNLTIPNKVIAAWTLNNLTPDFENTVAMISQSFRNNDTIDIDLGLLFSQLLDEARRLKSKNDDTEMALVSKPKVINLPKGETICSYCKKKGHKLPNCWKKYPEKRPEKRKPEAAIPEEEMSLMASHLSLENQWILDSGATSHICSEKAYFSSLRSHDSTLYWGKAKSTEITGIGTIKIRFQSTGKTAKIENCLYAPDLGVNLISIAKLTQKGFSANFSGKSCQIFRENNYLLAEGNYKRNLTFLDIEPAERHQALLSMTKHDWHANMGHISQQAVNNLPNAANGVELIDSTNKEELSCEICAAAKATKHISREPSTKASTYLGLVYSDICGPIKPETRSGYRYFVSFLDSATKYSEITLLKTRDEVKKAAKLFTEKAEKQSSRSLQRFHSDNAKEYKSADITRYFHEKGVNLTYSAAYCPEQNGSAERLNRTLLNKVRALLLSSNLSRNLWGEALMAANYLYNRTPHSSIINQTPYFQKTRKRPDLSNIRLFGSVAYKTEQVKSKLEARARPYILIGYGSNQYKLLDQTTGKVTWARDVAIIPNSLPKMIISEEHEADLPEVQEDTEAEPAEPEIQSGSNNQPESKNLIDQLAGEMAYPAEAEIRDPLSYNEAISEENSPEWLEAMKNEVESLERQKTWDIVDLPPNRRVISGKWVYKTKLDQNGQVDKRKARWVARGFTQKFGTDYFEIFANTVRPSIFRALIGLAAVLDWEIHQLDIRSAFLNADIEEEIFIQQPIGFEQPNKVCRLNKAIYGLKQSARQWQRRLAEAMTKLNLRAISSDNTIFIGRKMIIITHIDDMLIFSPNLTEITLFRKELSEEFELTYLGEAKFFLGVEIIRDRANNLISLTQRSSIKSLLKRFAPEVKNASNPCRMGIKLEANPNQASAENIRLFQQQIGSLMYLMTMTRPDLCFPIGLIARFMSNPAEQHFSALNRIWQYLNYSADFALTFQSNKNPKLVGYCDSDWGGDIISRKSTTGYLFLLGNSAISWASALQKTVALSSCEAEYMALKEATKEQIYLQHIFSEIPELAEGISRDLFTDSQSAIELAKNPVHHKRTKHIDIQYHFVRSSNENGEINLQFIPTKKQLADALTKEISNQKWDYFIENIGLTRL